MRNVTDMRKIICSWRRDWLNWLTFSKKSRLRNFKVPKK